MTTIVLFLEIVALAIIAGTLVYDEIDYQRRVRKWKNYGSC